ncbi:uncharacterized protein LOC124356525 [Homalodisca vitripennis]|uniref:uncharacterized protein LOC124356525 n=1 Tax=Homalodisca vitripennis TaxID=197043 RepID=UPI001EEBE35E|nr:uncharacterized protein LOC124356525 [Homalodisca vitripennis]
MTLIRKVCVFLLLNFINEVSMLNTCNKKIIENIYKLCPQANNILERTSSMGHVTYYTAPKKDVTPGVKCVKTIVEPPVHKCTDVHTIYYFDNTTIPPRQQDYKQCEKGKAHVTEIDEPLYL